MSMFREFIGSRVGRVAGAVTAGAGLALAGVQRTFAADYSTQIAAAAASLVADVTPAVAAAIVVALAIAAIFIAARLALRAFHLIHG